MRYATADQLATYSPNLDHPDDVDTYLRSASRLVTRAIRFARYTTAPSGLPDDAELAGALVEATCEQVTAWVLAGVHPTRGVVTAATEGTVTQYTVTAGPRTVTEQLAGASAGTQSVTPDVDQLTAEAWSILSDAGLVSVGVIGVRG